MRIILAGANGFIGSYLLKWFSDEGHDIKCISRKTGDIPWEEKSITEVLNGADVLINLAGHTINCRHNASNREKILNSRLQTTTMLGNAMKACTQRPSLWINASASAIYPSEITMPAGESTPVTDHTFLSQVVAQWEKCFFSFGFPETRQVVLRTSVVLGHGGAFEPLYQLSRFGLGGATGSGKQFFSWIHIEDYYRIVKYVIEQQQISGIINCTAKNPVANSDLMRAMRKAVGAPIGLPAPAFAVKIGAVFIGTESSLLLDSSYMIPQKLNDEGFVFEFPEINSAVSDIVNRYYKKQYTRIFNENFK